MSNTAPVLGTVLVSARLVSTIIGLTAVITRHQTSQLRSCFRASCVGGLLWFPTKTQTTSSGFSLGVLVFSMHVQQWSSQTYHVTASFETVHTMNMPFMCLHIAGHASQLTAQLVILRCRLRAKNICAITRAPEANHHVASVKRLVAFGQWPNNKALLAGRNQLIIT